MVKKGIRCVLCSGAFIFLVVAGWKYLSNRMELKTSHVKYDDFFQSGDSVDVLFFGSSHMLNAVFPDQLWEKYDITSYNLGNHGELLPTSYEVFRNALDYSSPKAVVVDMFSVFVNGAYYNKDFSHASLDAFSLTWTKVHSINALFDDMDMKCEFLANFCLYHSRWDEYLTLSPEYTPSVMKGAEMRVNVEPAVGELTASDAMDETMTDGIASVLQFKELCDERGIDLICVNIPYSGLEERDAGTNYAARIMREAGITYLDFRTQDSALQLDVWTDFYDTQHVNPLGGRKVTEYIGQYLIHNCNIQDRRESECAQDWNTAVSFSKSERANVLKQQAERGNLVNTLMMMKANAAKGIIVITQYSFFRNQGVITDLLQQMGFDVSDIASIGSDSAWVGIYDEKSGTAACGLVNTEMRWDLSGITKEGDLFDCKYVGYNHITCSYNGEAEVGLHNQMFMIYLFQDDGSLLAEQGFTMS